MKSKQVKQMKIIRIQSSAGDWSKVNDRVTLGWNIVRVYRVPIDGSHKINTEKKKKIIQYLNSIWRCFGNADLRKPGKAGIESFIKLNRCAYFTVFNNLNRAFFDLILICGSAGFIVMSSYKLYRIAEQSNKNE